MYAFYLNKTHENLNTYTLIYHIEKHFPNATSNTLAGPGAHPASPQRPRTYDCLGPKRIFSPFFKCKPNFNRNMAKTR